MSEMVELDEIRPHDGMEMLEVAENIRETGCLARGGGPGCDLDQQLGVPDGLDGMRVDFLSPSSAGENHENAELET